jgi:hypothetical protein
MGYIYGMFSDNNLRWELLEQESQQALTLDKQWDISLKY